MSVSIMQAAIQGANAAGTTNTLARRQKEEKGDRLVTTAMQLGHLVLASVGTAYSSGVSFGSLEGVVGAALLAPAITILASGVKRIQNIEISDSVSDKISKVCQVGIAVNAIANLAINPAYAASSLSLLAANVCVKSETGSKMVRVVSGIFTALCLISYGAQAALAKGAISLVGKAGVLAVGLKVLFDARVRFPASEEVSQDQKCDSCDDDSASPEISSDNSSGGLSLETLASANQRVM